MNAARETTVNAEVNYTGPMSEKPKFHANYKSLDRVTLDRLLAESEAARSDVERVLSVRAGRSVATVEPGGDSPEPS